MKILFPNIFRQFPLYPFFLCIYSVVFLWSANYVQVPAFVVVQPLVYALLLGGVINLLAFLIVRKVRKAAALTGLFLFLFFSYGRFYDLFRSWKALNFIQNGQAVALILCAALWVGGSVWILRTSGSLIHLTACLNQMTGLLLLVVLAQLGYHMVTQPAKVSAQHNLATAPTPQALASVTPSLTSDLGGEPDQESPDVYYILLDAYDREDLMLTDISKDNHEFITQLKALGFIIPNCTQSNYNTTVSSMAGTLNMNYLDQLGVSYQKLSTLTKNQLTEAVQPLNFNNRVMDQFRDLGYQIVTFKEDWPFIDFPHSDIVYNYQTDLGLFEKSETYHFNALYLGTTLLQPLMLEVEQSPERIRWLPASLAQAVNPIFNQSNQYNYQFAQEKLYQLDALEDIASLPGKKFVYAHLMTVHPPFTLTADGALRASFDQTNAAYADAVTYANQRLLPILKKILAESKTPPIIVLQGDHAYGWEGKGKDAFKILNAYYLPGNGSAQVYDSMTPVNTFRLIFSTYFDQDEPLIKDQSIWINSTFSGGYSIVPDTCVP